MGIVFARAPIGVFLWAYPLVCAGGAYDKTLRYSLPKVRCCCLKYCVVSKEGYVNYGKSHKMRVAFEVLELAMTWKIVSV